MKNIKFELIIYVIIVIASIVGLVALGHAHEDAIWSDHKGMGPCYGSANCGMGYVLCHDGQGNYQPYLFADGHFHVTEWTMPTYSCDAFFEELVKQRKYTERK